MLASAYLVLAASMLPRAARAARTASAGTVRGSLSLDSEVAASLDGGLGRGSVTDHLLKVGVWADGASLGLPRGGRLKVSLIAIESGEPSANYVGDAQGVSNIAAPSRSRLYALWYRQRVAGSAWTLRLGLLPADAYFDVTDGAGALLNSSFGTQPTLAANTVAPIYPIAGLGAMATWRHGGWMNRTALFQADPTDRASAFSRGALVIDEVGRTPSGAAGGTYRLGLWSYRPYSVDPFQGGKPFLKPATWGLYLSAEHPLIAAGEQTAIGFLRIGASPTAASTVPLDIQAGVLIPAPLPGRPGDQLSVGIATANLRGAGTETAYEITYALALSKRISLQPDLQYVDDLSGTHGSALVAIVRLHIDLE